MAILETLLLHMCSQKNKQLHICVCVCVCVILLSQSNGSYVISVKIPFHSLQVPPTPNETGVLLFFRNPVAGEYRGILKANYQSSIVFWKCFLKASLNKHMVALSIHNSR